jgi:hypothetical protein
VRALARHAFGDSCGVLAVFTGDRLEPGSKTLSDTRSSYFEYPCGLGRAEYLCAAEDAAGREVYLCAHLLTGRRRVKANAAPLSALYVDGDGARVPAWMLEPTAVVRSSPGREQFYWRLTSPVGPEEGETMNRRLAYAVGADHSGWDLTQLLRVPGTRNRKYPGAPLVRLVDLSERRHDSGELDRILPPLPLEQPREPSRTRRPENVGPVPNLSRLSPRMQNLIRQGNHGKYASRSEADFAACLAMLGAGYTEVEVWAVMTNPAHGISEKYLEKGRHGESYLDLTIGKAAALARSSPRRHRSKSKARRVWRDAI